MIEIYKNLFIDHHCFFVKLGRRPKPCKSEPSASIGFIVEQQDGKWTCRDGCYYDDTIKHELILVGENRKSIHSIIKEAVICAVLELVKEEENETD